MQTVLMVDSPNGLFCTDNGEGFGKKMSYQKQHRHGDDFGLLSYPFLIHCFVLFRPQNDGFSEGII